ncbi:MAG: Uma2 family endonuclease [Parafilimonas sp.]
MQGEIIDMAGASFAHNHIHSNLFGAIAPHLKDKECKIFGSDLRVEVKAKESYFYPDLVIVCGDFEDADDKQDMIKNPAVIIEISSLST